MANTYSSGNTALVLVDPLNDFLDVKGKLWPRIKLTAEKVDLVNNLVKLRNAADAAGIRVFYAPHVRYREGNYAGWKYLTAPQEGTLKNQVFSATEKGGEFYHLLTPRPVDIIAQNHWTSSGFANTDLDLLLKIRGIDHVVLAGLTANTCIESTGRFAVELGYHVTFLKDAVAAFSDEALNAAVNINYPEYGHAVLTTAEFISSLPKKQ